MNSQRAAVFVDGENLVFRYQDMLDAGLKARIEVNHRPDEFVWSPMAFPCQRFSIVRCSYYTSAVGDEAYLDSIVDQIQTLPAFYPGPIKDNRTKVKLNARVFKKLAKSQKSRLVDIQITLDSLRAAYRHDVELIWFLTGDGDFLPVIDEIMKTGKRVGVAAFSKGIAQELRRKPDLFYCLDDLFFEWPGGMPPPGWQRWTGEFVE
jgi:uncharacterized LabA/DUF88 family protein